MDDGPTDTTPTVESVAPSHGASSILVEASLGVAFSEEMDRASTMAAFSVSPSVDCVFSWNAAGDVLTCDPTSDLAYGTSYTITVADSATSAAGVALAMPVTSTFTTVQEPTQPTVPAVESFAPSDGASSVVVEASLQVVFSQEMSSASTIAAFSVSPSVSCSYVWNAAGDVLTCDPTSDLAYGTSYAVTVADSARSAAGVALANSVTSTFTTVQEPVQPPNPAPVVVSTSPQNLAANVPVNSDISVAFSIPMDTASVEAAAAASPQVPCTFVWNGDNTAFTCVLSAPLQSSTSYTVAIGTTARAANGEALEQPFAMSFSTEGAVVPTYYVYGGPGPSYDVYLGCLNCIETSIDSVFNDFGTFGEYASPSMDNQFDQYGSPYSNVSACNQYATDPPAVFDASGNYYGRLTINEFVPDRITNTYYLGRLETDICFD